MRSLRDRIPRTGSSRAATVTEPSRAVMSNPAVNTGPEQRTLTENRPEADAVHPLVGSPVSTAEATTPGVDLSSCAAPEVVAYPGVRDAPPPLWHCQRCHVIFRTPEAAAAHSSLPYR